MAEHRPQLPFSRFAERGYQPQRPIDIINREVPPTQALDFVSGCRMLMQTIAKEDPGIVLFPLRGAGPIEWTTEALMDEACRKKPAFIELPLGSISPNLAKPGITQGLNGTQKRTLIKGAFDKLLAEGVYVPGETKLLLVDEVQKGGTITQATAQVLDILKEYGDPQKLTVVCMQDSRKGLIGSHRTETYKRLAGNEMNNVKAYVQPISLFMVDRAPLLDVLHLTTSSDEIKADSILTVRNEQARQFFQMLARVSEHPDRAVEELNATAKQVLAPSLGATLLQETIVDAMTDPIPVAKDKFATEAHIMGWWREYAKKCKAARHSWQD